MKRFRWLIFLPLILAKVWSSPSVNFLKLPYTARSSALFGYSALSDDVGGVFFNPAGTANAVKQFGFTYDEHFQQIRHGFLGCLLPKKKYTLLFGFSSLYAGNIEGRTGEKDFNPELANIEPITTPDFDYDALFLQTGVGYARKVTSQVNFGATVKFIQSKIYDTIGYTLASDLGVQYYPIKVEKFSLGFNLTNLGFPIKFGKEYYQLPLHCVVGWKYSIKNLLLVSDISYSIFDYESSYTSLGAEFTIFNHLILRAGYKHKFYGWKLEGENVGLSCGVGINFYGTQIDYSVVPYGVLGLSHKISLLIQVDSLGKFYELFRRKLFPITPITQVGLEKSDEQKLSKEVLQLQQITQVQVQQQLRQEPAQLHSTSIKYSFKTNLIYVDTQNNIFSYKINLTSAVVVNLNNKIFTNENLNLTLFTRYPLPEKVELNVYVSILQPGRVLLDFTEIAKLGYCRESEIRFLSHKENLKFYDDAGQEIPFTVDVVKNQQGLYYYEIKTKEITTNILVVYE